MQLVNVFPKEIFYVIIIIITAFLLLNLKRLLSYIYYSVVKTLNAFSFDAAHKVILLVLPLIALTGVIVPSLLGMYNFSLLGLYLAVPMIGAPILYYFYFSMKVKSKYDGE